MHHTNTPRALGTAALVTSNSHCRQPAWPHLAVAGCLLCLQITNMGVLSLVLGAMCLLWSHIIWLVLLLLSLWRYATWQLVLPKDAPVDERSVGGSGEGSDSGAGSGSGGAETPVQ